MKKIVKLCVSLLLIGSSLNAEILFSLQDQYFENAYKQSSKASLYELKSVSVSMVAIYQTDTGEYRASKNRSGTMNVKLKKAINNFAISIKGSYVSVFFGRTPSIMIQSDTGDELVIAFNKSQIIIEGKIFEIEKIYNKTFNIHIEKNAEAIVISINGQEFLKKESKELKNLKILEQIIVSEDNRDSRSDALYDITIIKK